MIGTIALITITVIAVFWNLTRIHSDQRANRCPFCNGTGTYYTVFDHYSCGPCHGTGIWTQKRINA